MVVAIRFLQPGAPVRHRPWQLLRSGVADVHHWAPAVFTLFGTTDQTSEPAALRAGRRPVAVVRVNITPAGRQALSGNPQRVDGDGVARLTFASASADATLSYRTCRDSVATASTVSSRRLAEPTW
jgi:hypothetical protein